jgi:hypothetical protein
MIRCHRKTHSYITALIQVSSRVPHVSDEAFTAGKTIADKMGEVGSDAPLTEGLSRQTAK